MYTKQPKKLIIMNILDILKKYTDENHRLSQKEIQDILERDYEMKVDRKAIKRNLMNLIDFGLNPQPMGVPTEPIPVCQRIVVNFYTAKRLYHALGMTLQRHEAAFGPLEVDVNKRVQHNNTK